MIAIIFEVTPKSDKKADYLELAAECLTSEPMGPNSVI